VREAVSPFSRAERYEIWEPKTPGNFWATSGLLRDSFTFTFTFYSTTHACTRIAEVGQML